ncbi:MAG: hypothetical protein ACI9R3_003476 [Verrucomicrobiales bacterium]
MHSLRHITFPPWFFIGALSVFVWTTIFSDSRADDKEPQEIDISSLLDVDSPAHRYWDQPLRDPFTQFRAAVNAGKVALNRSSERAFVKSLLDALNVPVSSQMLVYSTTSLQLSRISPSNPRALYFNDDVYIGWIPGGRIEIAAVDPELGCVFFIFDVPRDDDCPLKIERSTRCMNCHATTETRDVPGVTIKSVVPGPQGGSLDAFRVNETGHTIPLHDRFGGWHLTGGEGIGKHWGNLIGKLWQGELSTTPLNPGERFEWSRYLTPTSDILAHLVHEHQAGFVNRVVEGTYLARAFVHSNDGASPLTSNQAKILDQQADIIVRYLLFADEAAFPPSGVQSDPAYAEAFLSKRLPSQDGAALRDLELHTRMFKFRCSYMIYSRLFQAMPSHLMTRVQERMANVLKTENTDPTFTYLPPSEKEAIRAILEDTLPSLGITRK